MIRGNGGGRPARLRVAAALIAIGSLVLVVGWWTGRPEHPPQPPAADVTAPRPADTSADAAERALPPSTPRRIKIPAVKINAPVVPVGIRPDGAIEVPPLSKVYQVGWYENGPTPGENGPAVLVGHVDSKKERGAFFELGALRPGRTVQVVRTDGTAPRFRIDRIQRVAKDEFPTRAVYGDGGDDRGRGRPELRLVTCGGAFDHARGHYVDNIIVYASMIDDAS
ncbi:class F sortase [Actinomadura chokoriensis]|uniref:class F sortase n=1 Tax=Actinomadura chokoriensis TaxID=454156 RepID=UPI0031FA201D